MGRGWLLNKIYYQLYSLHHTTPFFFIPVLFLAQKIHCRNPLALYSIVIEFMRYKSIIFYVLCLKVTIEIVPISKVKSRVLFNTVHDCNKLANYAYTLQCRANFYGKFVLKWMAQKLEWFMNIQVLADLLLNSCRFGFLQQSYLFPSSNQATI